MCILPAGRKSRQGLRAASLREALDIRTEKGAPDACWPWVGTKLSPCTPRQWTNPNWKRSRYGVLKFHYKADYAHRWAYIAAHGPITDGNTIDHTCFNGMCVNPAHLQQVSASENSRRYMANKHWPERRKREAGL